MQALHHAPLSKDEAFSRRLVMLGASWVMVLGLLLAVAYWLEDVPTETWRMAVNLLAGAVGLGALALGYGMRQHWRLAAYVLVWGMWCVIVLVAWFTGGVRSHNHMGFPVMLMFCGWVLGARATWVLLGVTAMVMLGFKAVDVVGWMPLALEPLQPSTWSYLLYHFGMLALTALVTLQARRYFMVRAADAEAALQRLRESEQQLHIFSLAVEQCPASILITNLQERVVYANQAFLERSGYSLPEVLGRDSRDVSTTGMDEALRNQARRDLSQGSIWQGDLVNQRKDGTDMIEDVRVAPIRSEQGMLSHYVELKQDITERVQAEATIHKLSNFDRITSLPNRFAFLRHLMELREQRLGKASRVPGSTRHGILLLDVDRFTSFNDVHGSVLGDQLLRATASRLQTLLLPTSFLVRASGDEFAIVLENVASSAEDAETLVQAYAQKLLQALGSEPLWLDAEHDSVRVSCCIGMSVFPELQGDTEIEAVRRASTALHEAKGRGPGHAMLFEEVMAENASRRYRIEKGLRRAVGEGELRMYIQGQFDAADRPVGAEVLVRWEHPEQGLLAPGEFIPVAEESELIVLLGDWVLEESCRLLAHPLVAQHRLLLSVNVSARQFLHEDFVAKLERQLEFSGADPAQLVLEVTEGLVLHDFDDTAAKMEFLRGKGIQFALDDFGTGYSSLAYLKRLPIQELKIDQSFVRDVQDSAQTEALVEAILLVSRRFGLRVVAEGVETQAQAQLLRSWEPAILCQGYLHERPMPWQIWMERYAQAMQLAPP